MAKRKETGLRSTCPVAGTLDIVGDRWTLLVVRDLLRGKRRYGELLESAERIPTNILAERLRRLEAAGLVRSTPYSAHPRRVAYELTDGGRQLADVLDALVTWGVQHVPGTRRPAPVDSPG